jgi:NAD(P)-dependent dehydrogenase (short-subunit alcohol dehydrogenase family)
MSVRDLRDPMSRTVLVAGVGRTLGTAVATALADRGDRVVLVARSRDVIEPLAADLRDDGGDAVAVRGDLTDPDEVARVVAAGRDAFGAFDGVVHAANVPGGGRFADCDLADFDRVWETRARAAFLLADASAEDLADGGRLVVAGTNYATEPAGSATAWDSAAAATRGLARSLAADPEAPDATYAEIDTALAPPGTDPGPVRTAAEAVAAEVVDLLAGDAPTEVRLPRRKAEA